MRKLYHYFFILFLGQSALAASLEPHFESQEESVKQSISLAEESENQFTDKNENSPPNHPIDEDNELSEEEIEYSEIDYLTDEDLINVFENVPPEAGQDTTSQQNNFIDIGVVLDGKFSLSSNNPNNFQLPGFQLGGEHTGLLPNGFSLGGSEINFQGTVDDLFFANLTIEIETDFDHVDVDLEEAYIETLSLPAGFDVTAGRYFIDLGYVNTQHEHQWDFADAPLVNTAFLGTQYNDDGIRLRTILPTIHYFEVGGALLRGSNFPLTTSSDLIGGYNLFARHGGDIGESHSYRIGASYLHGNPEQRSAPVIFSDHAHSHDDHHDNGDFSSFTGNSDLIGLDFVYKWAPNGNPYYRNFIFQTEFFFRHESGDLALRDDHEQSTNYRGHQQGWYAQAVYQFKPRWRTGLRYDWLSSHNRANDLNVLDEAGLFANGKRPQRISTMVDYSRSEFSRLRLQLNQGFDMPKTNTQVILQYIVSFGAHGAHEF